MDLLGTTENEIVGALWKLWWAARSEKNPDGVLDGYGPDEIVATMTLTHLGLEAVDVVEVLVNRTHLLDLVDGQFRVHNWTVGQRSGAKFKERSEIGAHGNHVRYDRFVPDECRYCAEHASHVETRVTGRRMRLVREGVRLARRGIARAGIARRGIAE